MQKKIEWNKNVKLILSDVDQTIADLYSPIDQELVRELEKILEEGKILFLISGQDVKDIVWRVTDKINFNYRNKILIGSCSGTEVWGFNKDGKINLRPFYSLYEEKLSEVQKKNLRVVSSKLISEFKLKIFPPTNVTKFLMDSGRDPFAVMYQDRGPQITYEFVNSYDMSSDQSKTISEKLNLDKEIFDFRIPFIERADQLLKEYDVPMTPRLAGEFAVDFAVEGVSKNTAVKFVLENEEHLKILGTSSEELLNADRLEVWGDKFSIIKGGTDRHISEALDPNVRSITFRQEDPSEFLPGYNIVVWDGEKRLQEGLLEYLKLRK